MASVAQRLAALEAEVAELRAAAPLREAFVDTVEARAFARGRESVLGGSSSRPSRPPRAERRLHAVPDPEPELEAGT